MTSVAVYSYTHSVTYVADNILKSFKDIIRLSGLDPSNLGGGRPDADRR
jgi:Bacterial HORMA domain 2